MKTISLNKFTNDFLEISKSLTLSETRLLYLLISDPDVINLSRNQIAMKIGIHRRTIWLGINKLKKLDYISDIDITEDGDIIISKKSDSIPNQSAVNTYDKLFNDYCIYRDVNYVIQLIKDFPDRIPETINGIRFILPENIDRIAETYSFVDVLKIINVGNEKIQKLKQENNHEESGFLDYSDKYMHYKSKHGKEIILRDFLLYFPFSIDKFIKLVAPNTTETVTEELETLVKDIYGIELSQLLKWSIPK